MFFIACLFPIYEMFLQVSSAVISTEMTSVLSLSKNQVGLFSSLFFWSYTVMQIPAGLIYDHCSTKKVFLVGLAICSLSTLLFLMVPSATSYALVRLLWGFGGAFAAIIMLVVASQWFSGREFATYVGMGIFCVCFGALMAQGPLAAFIDSQGWEQTFWLIACLGIGLTIVVAWFFKDGPSDQTMQKSTRTNVVSELCAMLGNRRLMQIAGFAFFIWAPVTTFGALWGIPYLQTAYGLEQTTASNLSSLVWVGVAIGCPLYSRMVSGSGCHLPPMRWSAILGVVSSTSLLTVDGLPLWVVSLLILGFGISSASMTLSFTLVCKVAPARSHGLAMGVNNTAIVLSGAVMQPLVGFLAPEWGMSGNDATVLGQFRLALAVVPLCYAAAYLATNWVGPRGMDAEDAYSEVPWNQQNPLPYNVEEVGA